MSQVELKMTFAEYQQHLNLQKENEELNNLVQEWKKRAKEASARAEHLRDVLQMNIETRENLEKLHDRLGHNSYEFNEYVSDDEEEATHTILPVDVNGEEFLKSKSAKVFKPATLETAGHDAHCGETHYQIWFDGGEEVMGGFKSFEELKDYFDELVKEMATYGKICIEAPISRPDKMACYAFDKESGECIENLEVEDLSWDIETGPCW